LFYAWGEPAFVLIMLLSIFANYIFALAVEKYAQDKRTSKIIVVLMLVFNLSLLFVFKYVNFFVLSINTMLGINLRIPTITLPIGISFFTFHAISYVLDVHRKTVIDGDTIYAQRNPINVGLYLSLFPQLIAGPIIRYKTVVHQIEHREENFTDFCEGVRRFIIGLSKKILISNNLAIIAEKSFSMAPSELSVSFAWLGAIAYSLQIFFDFAGYSDMAIGLGKMFGFHFMENFNYPYISKSISEFWRRWHISLGSWFRDYVYFPLGGSRKGKIRTIVNLSIVWFLTGFWHGANWTFMAWGLYFFLFIAIEKMVMKSKNNEKEGYVISLLKHIYVLLVLVFGWVLFRSDSITYAIDYIKTMMGVTGVHVVDSLSVLYLNENIWFLAAGIIFSMPIISVLKNRYAGMKDQVKLFNLVSVRYIYNLLYVFVYIYIFIVATSYIVKGSYNPFIYFNF
jgi:D-alanyl-lipoteichoic acid acyltransferase DltB (MBOAT superfamily)